MKGKITLLLAVLCFFGKSQITTPPGGRTCGTPTLPLQFEKWYNSLVQAQASGPKLGGGNIQSVFNIPVIVHIIHNNEALNSISATSGGNLNAAQVIDQVNILNEDFKGLNSDTSLIPNVFKPFLGKFQVNFCLAVVNPTGGILAEPGIDRINRTSKGWSAPPYSSSYVSGTIKPNSIWDPNRYLNIWVASLSSGLLGFATFPNPGISGVQGLSAPYGSATSDGVVILNTAFGSIGTGQFGQYDQGRTATHEIGHWMGLRHIWGDGTCATDYCNDTPPHQTANYGCPSFPYKLGTCSGNTTGEMTMNYMDYTNDGCMYMFTKDQKQRAQLIMSYSPIRAALITSTVCNLPTVGVDPGISSVAIPGYSQAVSCVNYINPVVNITNYGSVAITSLVVSYNLIGSSSQNFTWTGNAAPNTTFTLAIPQISGLSNGAYVFSVNISNPNGGTDVNLNNNNNQQQFTVSGILNTSVNSPTTCSGAAVTLSASGGTSYNWIGAGTGATISVSPTVTTVYTVNISSGVCSVPRTTTVIVTPGPSLSVNSVSVCSGVQVTLTASGASTYSWSNGSNSSSIVVSNSASTQYTVAGSLSNACTSTLLANVNIIPSPTLSATDVSICPGITATLIASGATSYSWDIGGSGSTIFVSPATTTNYVVTGVVNGCVATKTVTVTVGGMLSVFMNPPVPQVCVGDQIILNATGANSYTWSTGAQTSSVLVAPAATTSYTVFGLTGNCPGAQIITVTVNPLPVLSLSVTQVDCFGNSTGQINASASGNGPFTFAYNSGSVNLPAGTYTILVTDINGCMDGATIPITQPAPIQTQASGGITTCPAACNGTAQITASGGVGPYTATVYPAFISGLSFTNLCAGNYTYYLTDNNGCVQFNNFTVSANNAGVAIGTTVTNVTCPTCSDATLSVSGLSGTAPYSYTWMPGSMFSPVYPDVAVGCYTVTVKDAEGCFSETVACVSFDVGLKNISLLSTLTLYPNPVNTEFILSGMPAGEKTISIYDGRGRLIRESETSDSFMLIECSELTQGVYLLKLQTRESNAAMRFVKE